MAGFTRTWFNRLCYLTGAYTIGHPFYIYYHERENRWGHKDKPDYSNERRIRNLYNPDGKKWAIVTGASEGIGKAYAFNLANHGFNIVLASRNQSKLENVAAQIKA